MKKMRMTQVARVEDIAPHMRRIVLAGEDLDDFPSGKEGSHFKAIFPKPGEQHPKLGFYLGFKKWMRSYTIRAFDDQNKTLTVDFAVNDHDGLATDWAKSAQRGDYLGVAGPGESRYTNDNADWHLLIADLTALPAAAAFIEKLPKNEVGSAFIQVPTEADKQAIAAPKGIKIHWVVNADLKCNALLQAVRNVQWRDGQPSIFVAAESAQMREIKHHLQTQPRYSKELSYTSGYWKAKAQA